MIEIYGDLWDYYTPDYNICITTNGFVRRDGSAVMGRGCAREATKRIPGIERDLGILLQEHGNVPFFVRDGVISFPVKHHWSEPADLMLIRKSAMWLKTTARLFPDSTFILPRPGCGNGQLSWNIVRPQLMDLPDNVFVITR